jgi:hypothetical protein
MRIRWTVTEGDVRLARAFVARYRDDPFVRRRYRRNVRREGIHLSKAGFWRALFGAFAPTQQRSGRRTPLAALDRARPFPFRYTTCLHKRDLEGYAARILHRYGLRRGPTIARQLAESLELLENGLWDELLPKLQYLRRPRSKSKERETARFLAERITGLGPKQSRNLLQTLGLTRYEVPLDSRFARWLRERLRFPVPVTAAALGDPEFYEFVLDRVQELCRDARILPCMLDAAIFASLERPS